MIACWGCGRAGGCHTVSEMDRITEARVCSFNWPQNPNFMRSHRKQMIRTSGNLSRTKLTRLASLLATADPELCVNNYISRIKCPFLTVRGAVAHYQEAVKGGGGIADRGRTEQWPMAGLRHQHNHHNITHRINNK